MADQSDTPKPSHPNVKRKRGFYKWLFWLVLFFAGAWYLQQQGPITVNGISLTVPVSESPGSKAE